MELEKTARKQFCKKYCDYAYEENSKHCIGCIRMHDYCTGLYDEILKDKHKMDIIRNYFSANIPDGEKVFDLLIN